MFYNRKKTLRRFELKDEGRCAFLQEGSQRNGGHFHHYHTDMKQTTIPPEKSLSGDKKT
jgi:hypothetical protein